MVARGANPTLAASASSSTFFNASTEMIDLALDAALNSCKKRSTTNYQAMKTLPIAPYLLLIIATSLATSSVSNAQNFGQQRQGLSTGGIQCRVVNLDEVAFPVFCSNIGINFPGIVDYFLR
jgi:hypothetical protein